MENIADSGVMSHLWYFVFSSPITIALLVFQVWMIVHAIRGREWIWILFMLVMPVLGTLWYYFTVYRGAGSTTRGFELPGASSRRRIKELQAQIHHLDKPHHHSALGDVYFQLGKLAQAEASYRAAMERDPQDIDTRAHFAQCLLRQKKPKEALPLLQGVVNENPKHDYGYSLMALAETHMALGEIDTSIAYWQQVTERHNYARARVQLAELLHMTGKKEAALAEVREVLNDEPHAPTFQRKRDRVWIRRARKLLRQLK
ncbi:MAG: hypothetical protein QOF48_526 [Verrucomicrobiota bacterium]|jgi:hypothetical protein